MCCCGKNLCACNDNNEDIAPGLLPQKTPEEVPSLIGVTSDDASGVACLVSVQALIKSIGMYGFDVIYGMGVPVGAPPNPKSNYAYVDKSSPMLDVYAWDREVQSWSEKPVINIRGYGIENVQLSTPSPEPASGIVSKQSLTTTLNDPKQTQLNSGTISVYNGKDGAQGEQGIAGPQGPAGPKGEQGNTGPQGPQGAKGDIGPQGPQGNAGPEGIAGPQGYPFAGVTSTNLTPNATAGQETKIQIQSLGGSDGKTPVGKPFDIVAQAGLQGIKGEQGETGLQGPKGEEGAVGPKGASIKSFSIGKQGSAPLSYIFWAKLNQDKSISLPEGIPTNSLIVVSSQTGDYVNEGQVVNNLSDGLYRITGTFGSYVLTQASTPIPSEERFMVGDIKGNNGDAPPPNWLICDGSSFNEKKYPDLYAWNGYSNALPNLFGRVLKGGSPNGLQPMQFEDDAMINIQGSSFNILYDDVYFKANGAFQIGSVAGYKSFSSGDGVKLPEYALSIDISKAGIPVADEVRVKSYGVNWIIYAGQPKTN